MPLDNTITSSTYNSYVDLAEINVLIVSLSACANSAKWDALTDTEKEDLTIKSTDDLNSFQFCGALNASVISPNNMQWPRSGTQYTNGVAINTTEIPVFVQKYVANRNLEVLNFGPDQANSLTVPNKVKRQKLGGLEQEFFGAKELTANVLSLNDFSSYDIIKQYVKNSIGGNLKHLIRA